MANRRFPDASVRGALAVVLFCCGCSGGPSAIEPVEFDASEASAAAMETYDTDADGCLSDEELVAIPGLQKYKAKYDADQDGCVSAGEIAERISSWSQQGVGVRTLQIEVLLDGKALPDATLQMIPEAYLGAGPKPATGKTDASGSAKMSVDPEFLPEDLRVARMRGVFAGTYRIAVTHPQVKLPKRYTEGLALGDEIARDTVGDRILLELTRK